jgi:DNA-binding response OmpR family regulator
VKKKILIVDDESDYVEMLKMRLEANGFDVICAYDGIEGLKMASAGKPNVILLDIMMPGIDGREVLTRLKRAQDTAGIPVVMLTAKGESSSILGAQDSGAADYLIKPCEASELLDTINRAMRWRPSRI